MARKPLVLIALVALAASLGVVAVVRSFDGGIKLPKLGPECTVRADGEVTLDSVQMANAATITAVGVRRKMPEQAVVIALATALQDWQTELQQSGLAAMLRRTTNRDVVNASRLTWNVMLNRCVAECANSNG